MGCPDEQVLGQLFEGVLSSEARSGILAHVERCDSCQTIADAVLGSDEGVLLAPSTRVGRYEIVDLRGAGAMGTVYRALDQELDRHVAVKVVRSDRPEPASDLRDRLRAEARSLARVQSPNVVGVYDVGVDERGDVFVAMELVEGQTLRAWLASAHRTTREIVDMFVAAGRGLAAAHAAGVIHRDFKPDNVLVGADGRPRVSDFGLARSTPVVAEAGRAVPASTQTIATRTIAGTPAYMAPEQLSGGLVGPRADQFAFCVALAEALTGERPTAGRWNAPKVAEPLRRVIERGLAERADLRWPTLDALLVELSRTQHRRRTYRYVAAGLAFVGLAIALWPRTSQDTASCDVGAATIATLWTPGRAAKIEGSLGSLGDAVSAEAAQREVTRVIGKWQAAWASELDETCRLRPSDAPRREQCLAGVRDRADAYLRALESGTARDLSLAVRGAQELPSPHDCARTLGDDASDRNPLVPALDRRLGDAAATRWTGQVRVGIEASLRVRNEARSLGLRGVERRAELELGRLALVAREHAVGREHLQAAVDLAVEQASPLLQADALTALAELLAGDGERTAAETVIEVARATLRRAGGDALREATLDLGQCFAIERKTGERMHEELRQAAVLCERGRDALLAAYGADSLRLVDAERRLGDVYWRLGDYERAGRSYELALARVERVLGATSPARDPLRNDLAQVWMQTGRRDEAEALLRELVAKYPDDPIWRDSLAMTLRRRDAYAEELAERLHVLKQCTRLQHALCVSWQYPNLAYVLAQLGRDPEAEHYAQLAEALPVPPLKHDIMQMEAARAQIAVRAHDLRAARIHLEKASQILATLPREDWPVLARQLDELRAVVSSRK